jgi:hypothetical protein
MDNQETKTTLGTKDTGRKKKTKPNTNKSKKKKKKYNQIKKF